MKRVKIENVSTPEEALVAFNKAYEEDNSWYTNILTEYASKVDSIIEYGTWDGQGTMALLAGNPKLLITIDLEQSLSESLFSNIDNDTDLKIYSGNSLRQRYKADLIFLDTVHTYEHVKKELEATKDNANKYIIVHDTNYPPPRKNPKKLVRDAVIEFIDSSDFVLVKENTEKTGIMVLAHV